MRLLKEAPSGTIAPVVLFGTIHLAILIGYIALVYDLGLIDKVHLDETLKLYRDYADRAMAGQVPYRDYAIEYPLGAVPLFLAPRLVASPGDYPAAFMAEMMLFDAATLALVARHAGRGGESRRMVVALIWYTLYFASLCPLAVARYDLAPMAIAFAAACWWSEGRGVLGGAATGVGILVKIFPGAVAVPALVRDLARLRGTRGHGWLALLLTTGLLGMGWLALGHAGVVRSLRYHVERGVEVESLYAGVVLLYASLRGIKVDCESTHGAWHLSAAWGSGAAAMAFPAQVAALALVAWRSRRSGMDDGLRSAGAAILAFMVFGKVLSAQFPIWLFPFLAAQEGRVGVWARPLFLACCLLTAALYPWGALEKVLDTVGWAVALLFARNVLLLALLGLLLFLREPARMRPGAGALSRG